MSVNPSGPFLFNISDDVASYVQCSPREAVVERGILCTTDAFITNVKWCKEKASPFHEFLVFRVEQRSPGLGVSFILVERRVDSSMIRVEELGNDVDIEPHSYLEQRIGEVDFDAFDAADGETANTPLTLPASAPASAAQSPSSTGKTGHIGKTLTFLTTKLVSSVLPRSKESDDRLVFTQYKLGSDAFVNKLRKNHETLYTLQLKRERFSVLNLAVLASVVHRYHPRYNALAFQCHWFSRAIYCAMNRGWGRVDTPGASRRRCGKFGRLPIPQPRNGRTFDQGFLERFYGAWGEQCRVIEGEKQRREKEMQKELAKAVANLENGSKKSAEYGLLRK